MPRNIQTDRKHRKATALKKRSNPKSMLRWDKDRQRARRNRAIAEEIHDQQQTASMLRHAAPTLSTKAELRVVGEEAVRKHVPDPKGEWVIACECGHQATVRIAFSVALERALKCTNCGANDGSLRNI